MLALRHWLSLDKEKKGGGREREREKKKQTLRFHNGWMGREKKKIILIRHKRLTSLSMRTGERSIMGPQPLCA